MVSGPEVVTCGEAVCAAALVVQTATDTGGLPSATGRDRAPAAFTGGADSVHR